MNPDALRFVMIKPDLFDIAQTLGKAVSVFSCKQTVKKEKGRNGGKKEPAKNMIQSVIQMSGRHH